MATTHAPLMGILIVVVLALGAASFVVHAQPAATSGMILAAEGNPDPHYNVVQGSQQTNLYTGSATYTYPIQVPPGLRGLSPSLSLTYNSQGYRGTAGWLGLGWRLGGLGTIERSTKRGIPQYNANDTLLLDGQELKTADGTYRTEVDDYRRVEDKGEYWLVTDKGGTQYRYGYNNDSRIESVGRNGSVRLWALDKITDTHGNAIEVAYDEDALGGDYYPANITYNTGNGQTPLRNIGFVLEARPDASIDYKYGAPIKEDKRLRWVEAYANGSLVRKYELVYAQGQDNNRNLLSEIKLYGSEEVSSLPPTRFVYQESNRSWDYEGGTYQIVDTWRECCGSTHNEYGNISINSDGVWDIPINIKERSLFGHIYPPDSDYHYERGRLVDINGDGWDDLVGYDGAAYINERSRGWRRESSWDLPFAFANSNGDLGVRLADANGDGLTDIMADGQGVYFNNGSAWVLSNWALPTSFLGSGGVENGVRFGDLNGDGLLDMVRAYRYRFFSQYYVNDSYLMQNLDDTYAYYVWFNNGAGWTQVNGSGSWTYHERYREGNGTTSWTTGDPNVNSDGIWDIPDYFFYYKYDNNFGSVSTYYYEQGRLVDVNGDGLADFLGNSGEGIYLNDGGSWDADPNISGVQPTPGWVIPSGLSFYDNSGSEPKDTGVRTVDINGDGLTDILPNGGNAYINNGSGWVLSSWNIPVSSVDSYGKSRGVSYGDINGDGTTDVIQSYYFRYHQDMVSGWNDDNQYYYQIWFNEGLTPGLMSQQTSMQGGITNYTYGSSGQYNHTGNDRLVDLHFTLPVLTLMAVDNGMPGAHRAVSTIRYEYANGLYDADDEEFRGFALARETNPRGTSTEHRYHQDDALHGREYATMVNDSASNPYVRTENEWSYANTSGVFDVRLDRADAYTYDGASSNPKATRTTYDYDDYGNVLKTSQLGELNASGDERYAYSEYVYNTTAWMLDLVNHTLLRGAGNATVSEAWYYYDGGNISTAPVRGDLTREVRWLDTGDDPATLYAYDVFGNVVNATDALGRSTLMSYDSSHIFPSAVTNALGHITNYTYDPGTGNLLSASDPNGFVTSYVYDVFGRVLKEIRPYDSSGYPTVSYAYYWDGAAPEAVLTRQREENGSNNTLNAYAFVDGLGRPVQTRRDAEDSGMQIVQDTYYNDLGLVERQGVPYHAAYSVNYSSPLAVRSVSYDYDPLGRVNLTLNTDLTNRTALIDRWTVSESGENGHMKKKQVDAYGRIVLVQEHDNGSVYNTTYAYDAQDNLVNITDNQGNIFTFDYDSLGRKTGLGDPDLGNWTYAYDAVGNLVAQTDAHNTTARFEYDALNRVTREVRGNGNTTYSYDAETQGTLSELNKSHSSTHYYYDARLRKTRELNTKKGWTRVFNYSYDSADRLVNDNTPMGSLTNSYNTQGQLERVAGYLSDIDYNAHDKITLKSYQSGVSTSYTYNEDDFRLRNIAVPLLLNYSYDYDGVGNVVAIDDLVNGSTQNFSYDDLDRLVSAVESNGGYSQNYTYDSIGNLLSIMGDTKTWTFTYGNGTRIPHAITRKYTTPVLSLISPFYDEYTNLTWMLLNYSASDDDDDPLTYYVYGGVWPTASSLLYAGGNTSFNWTSLPDSVYSCKVTATDGYTNTTKTGKFTADLTPPSIAITNVDNASQTITWSASDNYGITHYDIRYNGTYFYKGLVSYDVFEELADGTYNVTVTAYDRAGSPSTATVILIKNTSGSTADGELLVFSRYIDYSLAPGETIKADIVVINRGSATLEDGVRIDVRDAYGWPIYTRWERVIVPANDMVVYPFEYSLSSNATAGLYSVKAFFTEDGNEKPSTIRWFNVGGGGQ